MGCEVQQHGLCVNEATRQLEYAVGKYETRAASLLPEAATAVAASASAATGIAAAGAAAAAQHIPSLSDFVACNNAPQKLSSCQS
jgi:hypothetical protein